MSFPRYPEYKDSGVAWLGEVPTHWESWKLAHAFEQIGSGTTPKSENVDYYEDGHIAWLNTGDLNDGELLDCEKRITDLAISDHSSLKLYPTGSLVIAMYGATIGKLGLLRFSATVNQACCVFSGKTTIEPNFLFYWFLGFRRQLLSLATGGGQPNISQEILQNIRIACPNIEEQHIIAAFLDFETAQIDALIAEQERLIELLKEKRQALISHAVTKGLNPDAPMKDSGVEWLGEVPEHWKITKTGRYISILSGYAFPSTGFSTDELDTKLLRGINVGVSEIKWNETVYWPRLKNDDLQAFELSAGDLVIGMDRPWIREGVRVAIISENDVPCLLVQRVAAIRTLGNLSRDYLFLFLKSEIFINYFTPDTTGVSVPHISPGQISNFPIPLPPLTEQLAIVTFLDRETAKIDELTAEANRAVELLKERRSALISAAVTGQIDVRGWVKPEYA